MPENFKKIVVALLKLGISAALLYLVFRIAGDQAFIELRDQPKNWTLLIAAFVCEFSAVQLTFVRWLLLVRALGLPFRLPDALRLGFLGFLLNFVSLGSVGGDLFKAIFLAREHPRFRTEAVATVVVDRLLGLYALLLVAAAAVIAAGLHTRTDNPRLQAIVTATLVGSVGGAALLSLLFIPGLEKISGSLARLPLAGVPLTRLLAAVLVYRRKFWVILISLGMSIGVHLALTLSIYLIARGLPGEAPTLLEHMVIAPLAMLASAVPLPGGGIGSFELTLSLLYAEVSPSASGAASKGLVVAICYRLITLLIAGIGGIYYLTSRREVAAAIEQAEIEGEALYQAELPLAEQAAQDASEVEPR